MAQNNQKTAANNKKGTNNKKGDKKEPSAKDVALTYNRNVPVMLMIAIFLFFVMFQLLKAMKYRDNMLRKKIDREIRKKLYHSDDYY
jgi:hypothetical protein